MNFSLTEEQLNLKNKFTEFGRTLPADTVIENDQNGTFDRESWNKCAEFGMHKMASVSAYGGEKEEIDILNSMVAMEGFGKGCVDNGLAFALNAHMWTVQLPIVQFGSEEQKKKFLPKMVDGSWIGCHAMTEPDTGSDVYSMKTSAEKTEGGYVLNGEKRLLSLAPIADLFLVFANAKPKLGKWGITAFLIPKDSPGLRVGNVEHKMGLRTVPIGSLVLDNCFVPDENRLGKEGSGFAMSNASLEYERCSILASQLGRMEAQLEKAVDYAKNREQFGQSIGKFQSVSNRIADMKMRMEMARLMLYKTAWLKDQGKPAMMEAALLKLYLSESFIDSSLDAIRIHGGIGYLSEYGIERDLRDAVGGVLYAGTSDIQRNIISGLLGL